MENYTKNRINYIKIEQSRVNLVRKEKLRNYIRMDQKPEKRGTKFGKLR